MEEKRAVFSLSDTEGRGGRNGEKEGMKEWKAGRGAVWG